MILCLPVNVFAGPTNVNKNANINKNTNIAASDSSAINEGVSLVGGDSKAYGFSHSLGDVDINQCLGSTQWGTIIVSKQKLVLNKWCAAEVYDAKGMYSVAAKLRCQIPEINKLFNTDLECIRENTWTPPPTTPPGSGPDGEETRPDAAGGVSEPGGMHRPVDPEAYVQQQIAINIQEEELETLEQRVARIEYGGRIAAQKAQARRDYAQHTIKRLENDPEE